LTIRENKSRDFFEAQNNPKSSQILISRRSFPKLSVNEKHFSSRVEAAKFLEERIVPYVKKERESRSLSSDQKALVIFDVFKGQMTDEVLIFFRRESFPRHYLTSKHDEVLPAVRSNC
jgi:hypothetical protein